MEPAAAFSKLPRPLACMLLGFQMAGQGSVVALFDPTIRPLLLRPFAWLALFMMLSYVAGNVALLPFRLVLMLLGLVVRRPDLDDMVMAGADAFLHQLVLFWTPFLAVSVLRYVWFQPLEDLFRSTLARVDDECCAVVYSREPASLRRQFERFAVRTAKTLALTAGIKFLSWLPWIGVIADPLSRLYVYHRTLGLPAAVGIVAFRWVPLVSAYMGMVLPTVLACRSVTRELLEPYLARMCHTEQQRREFFNRHGTLFLSFTLPFVLVMSVPVIGPLAYGLAQAAVVWPVVWVMQPVQVAGGTEHSPRLKTGGAF